MWVLVLTLWVDAVPHVYQAPHVYNAESECTEIALAALHQLKPKQRPGWWQHSKRGALVIECRELERRPA